MKRQILILTILLFVSHIWAQSDRMNPELLWSLGRISLYDISPNGKTILFGVTNYDVPENKGSRDLFTIPVKGGEPTQITNTPGSESEAQYRPDGKKIGFMKAGKMWEMNPNGSDAQQVSEEEMGSFKYAPDGQNVLFIRDVKYDKSTQQLHSDLPKAEARIIDDLMYRHWDGWEDGSY